MRPKKDNSIAVALIGAAAVVIAALVGYFATHQRKTDSVLVAYTGKVKDAKSNKPVADASVAITEDQKVPQRFTTDSEGVFFAQLSKDTQTMLLEVTAEGYAYYSRRGPTVRTGSEDIFLEPVRRQPYKQPDPAAVNPETPCERYHRAGELASAGKISEAEREYESALRNWDENNEQCDKAFIYKDLAYLLLRHGGKYRDAELNFLAALQEPLPPGGQPRNDGDVYHGLAEALRGLGTEHDSTGADAAAALASNPDNTCQHYELAKYLDTDKTLKGPSFRAKITEYKRALQNWSDKCGDRVYVVKDLGCAYALMDDSTDALQYLNQVPASDSGAQYCRGLVHH